METWNQAEAYERMSDAELAEAAQTDAQAFEELVRRYYPLIFSIGRAWLQNPDAAEDLAQEVVLRLHLNLGGLRDSTAFPRWIRQVTRNLANNWLASGQVRSRLVPMVSLEEVSHELQDVRRQDAREWAGEKQERSILEVAIRRLRPDLREVVLLHYAEGLSKSEVARQLGIHPSSVGRHLDRALVMLRHDLQPLLREAARPLGFSRQNAARVGAFAVAVAAMSGEAKAAVATAVVQNTTAASTSGGIASLASSIGTTLISGGMLVAKGKVAATAAAVAGLALVGFYGYPKVFGEKVPRREFRGAWIPSVANMDWPSKPGLSSAQQKAELVALLDKAAEMRFNAVALQVRPCADALYESPLEPWSEFLTGVQGQSPGWDPLEFAVAEAHKRCLELHAWLNPYRAHHASEKSAKAASHISRTRPALVKRYGQTLWMDPGEPDTTQHTMSVVQDIVRRYDVDGIHFDDYFYPYQERDSNGKAIPFPDDASWGKYQATGGKLTRDDWRRENVNEFIRRTYTMIKQTKPHVLFGVAPVGSWRPDHPSGSNGTDTYARVYADTRKWWNNGWMDYLSPQIAGGLDAGPNAFPKVLAWWAGENSRGRHLWPGMTSVQNTVGGIDAVRDTRGAGGTMQFSLGAFVKSGDAKKEALLTGPYKDWALVPASTWLDKAAPAAPKVTVSTEAAGAQIKWTAGDTSPLKQWCVYRKSGGRWSWSPVPAEAKMAPLQLEGATAATAVAVTAVDRAGNESPRIEVSIKR